MHAGAGVLAALGAVGTLAMVFIDLVAVLAIRHVPELVMARPKQMKRR